MVGCHSVRDFDTSRQLCFERLDCTLKSSMLNFLEQETYVCLLRHRFALFFVDMVHFLALGEKGLKGKGTLDLVVKQLLQLIGFGYVPRRISFPCKMITDGFH